MSELWYTEKQTKNFGITMKVNKTLHTEQTEFQHLEMVETEEFGNMLFLDGMVMTSEKDFKYSKGAENAKIYFRHLRLYHSCYFNFGASCDTRRVY
ncbi:hypothetical protein LV454_27485, partial [Escherichia coli]|nr:hypothetical protein [Escherichia coli]